ncbi:Plm2p [Saccharomyces eubayanus]|uniref:Plm2p n=1 Tax=Saccharomyces eubayanus TaxID=1080349 RepID=UPI0006C5FE01|nr:PLM2-like protein [Saccharomyces eubayanus]KOH01305.1 PLM2-like protein [Saccharomyces eubayanus]
MSHLFPPSSPVADKPLQSPQKELSVFGKSSVLTLGRKRFNHPDSDVEEYPTPDPSSSIGRLSSPVKNRTSNIEESKSTCTLLSPSKKMNRSAKFIKVELDPTDPSRLAIGRKKSVCNVILPCRKNISRQHAFISYVTGRNEIKLECNGTNGLSVLFPCSMDLHLLKPFPTRNFYKLMMEVPANLQNSNETLTKSLQKNNDVSSFALVKGEAVSFPYIEGTLINFTGATVCLCLKEVQHYLENCNNDFNEENSTETEDELCLLSANSDDFPRPAKTPSMKLIPVAHSPCTELISKPSLSESPAFMKRSPITHKTTPQSSFVIQQPCTPKKLKRKLTSIKNNTVQETPLPKDKVTEPPNSRSSNGNTNEGANHRLSDNFAVETRFTEPLSKITDESPSCKRQKTLINNHSEIFQLLAKRGIHRDDFVHVLCNHLAFSNLQQTPLSDLQNINSITSQLSRSELKEVLDTIGCIGIIIRAGKDASGNELEDEYYYDIENDDNDERKILYNSLKGSSRLRTCRKKHKQYFWKKPTK